MHAPLSYAIQRWDGVIGKYPLPDQKSPMIYIKPDLAFIEFARVNKNAVMCTIQGTDTVYDGRQIPGIVEKSSHYPSCRPNFYEATGLYVITLWSNWYGYPPSTDATLGQVTFHGLVPTHIDTEQPHNNTHPNEHSFTEDIPRSAQQEKDVLGNTASEESTDNKEQYLGSRLSKIKNQQGRCFTGMQYIKLYSAFTLICIFILLTVLYGV